MKTNRTNAPRTCLYCGKKLQRVYDWKEVEITREQHDQLGIYDTLSGKRKPAKFDGCRIRYAGRRSDGVYYAVLSVPTDTYGYDGQGYFHSGTCARFFGSVMAMLGKRLAPTGDPS